MEDFYRNQYGGTVLQGQALVENLKRAEDVLASYARTYTVTGSERDRKMALCAMAETLEYFAVAQNGQGGLHYASVGTVSVSGKGIYSAVDISPKAQAQELYRCAATYLHFYRGVS